MKNKNLLIGALIVGGAYFLYKRNKNRQAQLLAMQQQQAQSEQGEEQEEEAPSMGGSGGGGMMPSPIENVSTMGTIPNVTNINNVPPVTNVNNTPYQGNPTNAGQYPRSVNETPEVITTSPTSTSPSWLGGILGGISNAINPTPIFTEPVSSGKPFSPIEPDKPVNVVPTPSTNRTRPTISTPSNPSWLGGGVGNIPIFEEPTAPRTGYMPLPSTKPDVAKASVQSYTPKSITKGVAQAPKPTAVTQAPKPMVAPSRGVFTPAKSSFVNGSDMYFSDFDGDDFMDENL